MFPASAEAAKTFNIFSDFAGWESCLRPLDNENVF